MKGLINIFLAALFTMCVVNTAVAADLNKEELLARSTMKQYLKKQGIDSDVDDKDNSLNFLFNGTLYWLTFEGDAKAMLFTLHHRTIKVLTDEDRANPDVMNNKLIDAFRAAAYLNAANPYKAWLNGEKVELEFPVYATNAVEYQKVFPKIFATFKNVEGKFDICLQKATQERLARTEMIKAKLKEVSEKSNQTDQSDKKNNKKKKDK